MTFIITAFVTFIACFILMPIILGFARLFGLYAIVSEGTCHVYVLFGRVLAVLKEPGFYFLPFKLGPAAFIISFAGRRHVLDMRRDPVRRFVAVSVGHAVGSLGSTRRPGAPPPVAAVGW